MPPIKGPVGQLPEKARRIFIGAVLVLFVFIFWRAYRPLPSFPPLPAPNGFDDFAKAAATPPNLTRNSLLLPAQDLQPIVATNTATLKLIHQGLSKKCGVPVEFSLKAFGNQPDPQALQSLGSLLVAHGRVAEANGRPGDAAQSYIDAVRFSQEVARGGVTLQKSNGLLIEAPALQALDKLLPNLSALEARQTVRALETIDHNAESPERTVELTRLWVSKMAKFDRTGSRIVLQMPMMTRQERSFLPEAKKVILDRRRLLVDLACHAYYSDKRKRPAKIEDLVPGYLGEVPLDPNTGEKMPLSKR